MLNKLDEAQSKKVLLKKEIGKLSSSITPEEQKTTVNKIFDLLPKCLNQANPEDLKNISKNINLEEVKFFFDKEKELSDLKNGASLDIKKSDSYSCEEESFAKKTSNELIKTYNEKYVKNFNENNKYKNDPEYAYTQKVILIVSEYAYKIKIMSKPL